MQYIVQILLLMLSCTYIFVINQFRLNFWPFFVVVIVTKYFKNGMELDTFDYRQKKQNRFRHRPFCCSDNACVEVYICVKCGSEYGRNNLFFHIPVFTMFLQSVLHLWRVQDVFATNYNTSISFPKPRILEYLFNPNPVLKYKNIHP